MKKPLVQCKRCLGHGVVYSKMCGDCLGKGKIERKSQIDLLQLKLARAAIAERVKRDT
jgi:DnaJ-class molecular chaperone